MTQVAYFVVPTPTGAELLGLYLGVVGGVIVVGGGLGIIAWLGVKVFSALQSIAARQAQAPAPRPEE